MAGSQGWVPALPPKHRSLMQVPVSAPHLKYCVCLCQGQAGGPPSSAGPLGNGAHTDPPGGRALLWGQPRAVTPPVPWRVQVDRAFPALLGGQHQQHGRASAGWRVGHRPGRGCHTLPSRLRNCASGPTLIKVKPSLATSQPTWCRLAGGCSDEPRAAPGRSPRILDQCCTAA